MDRNRLVEGLLWHRDSEEAWPSRLSPDAERRAGSPAPAEGVAGPVAGTRPGGRPGGSGNRPTRPLPPRPLPPRTRPGPASGPGTGPPAPRLTAAERAGLVNRIIDTGDVEIDFQAVLDVTRAQVVGFEALARGPEGPLRSPARLFAAARALGRAGELDWVCRAAAFRAMLERRLHPSVSLFVNVEPDSLNEPCPPDLAEIVWQAEAQLRVFVDLPGRTLARHPHEVLEAVRRARAARWGVAVDDVEFSAAGLALLPILEPDVIKLDHSLLTTAVGHSSEALTAALSETERTGASLLVENVEDAAAKVVGRCLGARYQQGRLLGAEGPLPSRLPPPLAPLPLLESALPGPHTTPWEILAAGGAQVAAAVPAGGVSDLVRAFATQAGHAARPPVVAVVLPDGPPLVERALYRMLSERCPLTMAVGRNVAGFEDWGVRVGGLPEHHPMLTQACFLALSPTVSMVVGARRHRPAAGSRPAEWDLAVSQDPALCRRVVRALLHLTDTLAGGVNDPDGSAG